MINEKKQKRNKKSVLSFNKKSVNILGSTGSIGRAAVSLILSQRERFEINLLSAYSNWELLIEQSLLLRPKRVLLHDAMKLESVKHALAPLGIEILDGEKKYEDAICEDVDLTILGIVGSAGILPTYYSMRRSKVVATANKETIVCAGKQIMQAAKISGCEILPIDSEHNAILQVLENHNRDNVSSIVLTASGGPFRLTPKEQFSYIRREDALRHPTWKMGEKVTIDSATMMNKGLEIIEAHYLFDLPSSKIEVVVHPESIVHGIVNYDDGSSLASLSNPDMKIPISQTLFYPHRFFNDSKKLDYTKALSLNFHPIDLEKFRAIEVARSVLTNGGIAPIIFNGANEVAVRAFLDGVVRFDKIVPLIEEVLSKIDGSEAETIEEVLSIDRMAKAIAQDTIAKIKVLQN